MSAGGDPRVVLASRPWSLLEVPNSGDDVGQNRQTLRGGLVIELSDLASDPFLAQERPLGSVRPEKTQFFGVPSVHVVDRMLPGKSHLLKSSCHLRIHASVLRSRIWHQYRLRNQQSLRRDLWQSSHNRLESRRLTLTESLQSTRHTLRHPKGHLGGSIQYCQRLAGWRKLSLVECDGKEDRE